MLATLLALLTAAPLQTTWTVDDNDPADFPTIQLAIDAASDGDLVLIKPGKYQHFHLAKALHLVGKAGSGPCVIEGGSTVSNVPNFALVGLQFDRLFVLGVIGEGLLDDCKVGPFVSPVYVPAALEVRDSSQLTVQRTAVVGGSFFDEITYSDEAGVGASVVASGVVFVDCTVYGHSGSCIAGNSDGAPGLVITDASEVLLAATSVVGGNCDTPGIPVCSGTPADAVDVQDSTLVVRGDAGDKLSAGFNDSFPELYADAIHDTGSNVVWSGVTIALGDVGGVQPAEAEPFVLVEGGKAPGDTASIGISGPPGAVGLLLLSGAPGDVDLPGWDAHLWLDPALLLLGLPVVTTGQSTPVLLTGTLPTDPMLAGVIVRGQVAFPGVASTLAPGTKLLGNPFAVPFRF